ncbi:MAG: PAS domain S-box protein [Syntrophaceae bacterium]|nr:PAS domain S-box protein [Syntrophaceae bacterium]
MKNTRSKTHKNKTVSKKPDNQQKRTKALLKKREAQYHLLADHMQDYVWIMDLNLNWKYASPSGERLIGYTLKELQELPLDKFLTESSFKTAMDVLAEEMEKALTSPSEKRSVEFECRCKDGRLIWVESTLSFIMDENGKPISILGVGREITDRKKAEEALRQSEAQYRLLADHMKDYVWIMDLNLNWKYASPSGERLVGYTLNELQQLPLDKFLTESSFKTAMDVLSEEMEKALTAPSEKRMVEFEACCKDGRTLWVESTLSFILDENGKPSAILGEGRDITERKKAEEALRQSEAQYRLLADHMTDYVWLMDMNLKWIYFSPSGAKLLGYSMEELQQLSWDNILTKSSFEIAMDIYSKEMEKASTSLSEKRVVEFECRCKDGRLIWVETLLSFIMDENGKPSSILGEGREVTERKQAEEALRQNEAKYRLLAEHIKDEYVFIMDLNLKWTYVSPSGEKLLGYTLKELQELPLDKLLAPTSFQTAMDTFAMEMSKASTAPPPPNYKINLEMECHCKDSRTLWIDSTFSFIQDNKGNILSILGEGKDITELKQAEKALQRSEEKYRNILENIQEGYFEVDLAGNFTFFNDALCRITACPREELLGMNYSQFSNEENTKEVFEVFNKVYTTEEPTKGFDWKIIRKDGTEGYVAASASLLKDSSGKPTGFRGIIRDITERKKMEQDLNYMATHDILTGLPNRLMFNQLLKHSIQSAQRNKRQLAVLFIDLDRFKIINDTLGHEAGDQLLKEIALRFKESLRAVDVVGRLGGDEFIIMIEEVNELNKLEILAQKILNIAIKPIVLMGEECHVTASIGISIYPNDGENEQSLVKNADIAMYLAKEEGRNNYQFYSQNIKSQRFERFSIETNLRRALERNELYLEYQARLDFKTDQITGVEALLRWNNQHLGSIPPNQFLQVAEETGLIIPIGRWVMKKACAQNVVWQQHGLPPVCMAINLSLRQLIDDHLTKDVKAALEYSGMSPNLLELEITENMVMHNPARIIAVLTKIKEMGVRIAIDDFGIGYSSLAQIKHFPIDILKMDKSFLRNLPKDSDVQAIIEAIINMGKALSLTVVAKGVETLHQDDFLRTQICDEMQGFYFSKPVDPDKLADLLRQHKPFSQK